MLLRRSEVAKLLTVSEDTVARLVKAGKLRQCYPSTGVARIAKSEVDRYIAEISGEPAHPPEPAPSPKKLSRKAAMQMLR